MRTARWFIATGCALALATACLLGCRNQPAPASAPSPPWFTDIAGEVGLHFVHDPGPVDGKYFMPQIMGSGCALFDFDGDGLLDAYLLHNGGPKGKKNQLFRQQKDGTLKDVSKGSGLDFAGYCMGVAVGDVNNDGRPDLLVTEYGGVRLFLNNGDGTFTDFTKQAGLKFPLPWPVSAAFVDYDRDGRLDLVVVNYLDYDPSWPCHSHDGSREYCFPRTFKGTATRLFRNVSEGPQAVRFEDVSLASGIGRKVGPGLGVLCADFDGDGWPDIFVANDGAANHLWINQKDGTFKEEARSRGVAVNAAGHPEGNMGIGWGDVDGDGLQDLFVTHLIHETNTLWKQGPRGQFSDTTGPSGMGRPGWRATGFGTVLADFDNDGALDAAIVNGKVTRGPAPEGCELGPFFCRYAELNQLFRGDGKGRFHDLSADNQGKSGISGTPNIGRGLTVGDLRNDGALGLLVTGVAGRAQLFRNVVPDRGHWLVVRVFDAKRKRDALGAEITVVASGQRWVRTAVAAASYLSSNDPRAHFGLGTVQKIDAIEVLWPDGKPQESRERFAGGAVDRHVTLVRGRGRRVK
jgi:hypothetical protein